MTSVLQEEINRLFMRLYQWRSEHSDRRDMMSHDDFIRTSLGIVSMLVDDERLEHAISRDLSIVMDPPSELSLPVNLVESFVAVENELEESLRGFSSLLNWVLEENIIRREPLDSLMKVPGIDDNIANHFSQLCSSLIAYFDLEDAFNFTARKTPTVLFLLALTELYDELFCHRDISGQLVIAQWLKWRAKNEGLKRLYENAMKYHDIKCLLDDGVDKTCELLLIMICLRVARGESITKTEAPVLDEALNKFSMLGLSPLVDSGFLSVEDEDLHEKQMGKTAAKILRVK